MTRPQKHASRSRTAGTFRGVVFDIDGTLALANKESHGYDALPGARDVLVALSESGIPAVAFTNGTVHTPAEYRENLLEIGLDFPLDRVLTPASVSADFFTKKSIRRVLVLGVNGVSAPLELAGIETVRPGDSIAGVQAVLVGWFPDFRLRDLEAACNAVWAGAALFTASNAPFFATRSGRTLGISGAIGAMIGSVTGRRATVLGKPSVHGLRVACARMGLRPGEVVVIGDDPGLEVTMARRGGACAIGILTGISGRDDFLALPESLSAHFIFDSLPALLESGLIIKTTRTAFARA